jgi:hypothetical protein
MYLDPSVREQLQVRSIDCIPRLSTTTLLPWSSNSWTSAGWMPGTCSVFVSLQSHSRPPPGYSLKSCPRPPLPYGPRRCSGCEENFSSSLRPHADNITPAQHCRCRSVLLEIGTPGHTCRGCPTS